LSGTPNPAAPLPPGPRAGVLAQTVGFHRDPLSFLRGAQRELGDVFTLRLLTARPLVVIAEPDAVGRLLDGDPALAHAGAGRLRILPFAARRSVFGGDAEAHRSARARIAPALSEAAIARHRPEMTRIAARHAAGLPLGRPFRLLPRMRALTDEIFVRLVLGVGDGEIAGSLIAAIQRMLWTPGNPPVTLPGRGDGLVGELGQLLFRRRRAPVARHLRRAIAARRAEAPSEGDVLGCMVAALGPGEDEAIVEELMSLLMAAQEPPAIALAWLLDRLGREPALAERFVAEPEGEAAEDAVRETLRLQPPASAALRRLAEPLRAGGHELPAGLTTLLPTSLLHRDPRTFTAPDLFRPGRWRSGAEPGGPYFPFGGGARRCVGEPLARAEIATAVPALLAAARLTPVGPEPERMVQRATVLVPRGSLVVRATAR
jgi:cytochrome P450 family 135